MAKNAGWELLKEIRIAQKALAKFCPAVKNKKLCTNCGECISIFKEKEKEFFDNLEPKSSLASRCQKYAA